MKGLKFLLKHKTMIKLCAELGVETLCAWWHHPEIQEIYVRGT